jgi:predicted anti-sigma-YlaC factor YlaD
MTCREVLEFLNEYLDGNLPLRQRLVFEVHLRLCRACRDYLDGYRKTIHASRTALRTQDRAIDQPLPDDLVKAILAARTESPTVEQQ